MKKGQKVFWLLFSVFALWASVFLLLQWIDFEAQESNGHHQQMGGATMSSMMTSETNLPYTLCELIAITELQEIPQSDNSSHHESQRLMVIIQSLSTGILFIVFPLIVGGSAFLIVNWI